MSAATLTALCQRVRPELACLGDLGASLVAMLGVVERAGTGRDIDARSDPSVALDVLTTAGPGTDPAGVRCVGHPAGQRHTSPSAGRTRRDAQALARIAP